MSSFPGLYRRWHDGQSQRIIPIDLGKLVQAGIPEIVLEKAVTAYGADIERKAVWSVNKLTDHEELRHAADVLQMDHAVALEAIRALRTDCRKIWPEARFDEDLSDTNGHGM